MGDSGMTVHEFESVAGMNLFALWLVLASRRADFAHLSFGEFRQLVERRLAESR